MASKGNRDGIALRTVGDWIRKMDVPLAKALHVSVEILGRTGLEACKHAVILMAKSARNHTPVAMKYRDVAENTRFKHLLNKDQYATLGRGADKAKYYKWHAFKPSSVGSIELFSNDKKRIARIGNRGLAKRSWMWDLGLLNLSKPIPGTSEVFEEKSQKMVSCTKRNRLSYINKIMPAGFEKTVEDSAKNVIMAQAAKKMQAQFARAIEKGSGTVEGGTNLGSFFLGAGGAAA